ncbi:MAG: ATP-binding protein [Minicystis sp.]
MIEYLHLQNVGPAPEMTLELAPRLNVITGDNGLGKSFLLDVAWWALTRRWPAEVNLALTSGLMARPLGPGTATIDFSFHAKSKKETYTSKFDRRSEAWTGRPGRPANPGLVLYAQVDGGFSVWDPARNYWGKSANGDVQERQPAYVFSAREVWNGLKSREVQLCNGLIADWALWQKEGGAAFAQLSTALRALSPSPDEPLLAGELGRLSVGDSRWIPTLRMPYGRDVLVSVASAGMRRIVALAYLLVWAWQEHVRAAELLDEPPTRQVTFLIDEIESHLHPRWQRTIVSSLLAVMGKLAGEAAVQILAATHSPLLLASIEPLFDPETDAWFDLDLVGKGAVSEVQLTRRPFVRRGDVSAWLRSEAFDLKEARSLEAETAIGQALALAKASSPSKKDIERVHKLLQASLGDVDRFWVRWTEFRRAHEGSRKGTGK